jgi:hypothetical protein
MLEKPLIPVWAVSSKRREDSRLKRRNNKNKKAQDAQLT